MTSLDILFWMLIALLGGVAWAIEAGLTMRHRGLLLSSTLSAFASIVFVMFWVDDDTSIELTRAGPIKRVAANNGERGQFDYEDVEGKKKKDDDGSKKDDDMPAKGPADDEIVYSPEPFRDCTQCPELVIVSTSQGGPSTVKPYAVGRLEILRREYEYFVKQTGYVATDSCDIQSTRKGRYGWRNPGFEQDGQHPVVCTTPIDADAYVEWLSRKAQRQYRLMSETEWDFAARAGTSTPYWQGMTISPAQANYGKSRDGTIPGGSLPANKFGLSDVNGNVWEITGSCKSAKRGAEVLGHAVDSCDERIVKGGAWNSTPEQLRADAIKSITFGTATNYIGFRVARSVDDQDNGKILSKAKRAELAADDKAAAEIVRKERAAAEAAEHSRLEAEYKASIEPPKKAAE